MPVRLDAAALRARPDGVPALPRGLCGRPGGAAPSPPRARPATPGGNAWRRCRTANGTAPCWNWSAPMSPPCSGTLPGIGGPRARLPGDGLRLARRRRTAQPAGRRHRPDPCRPRWSLDPSLTPRTLAAHLKSALAPGRPTRPGPRWPSWTASRRPCTRRPTRTAATPASPARLEASAAQLAGQATPGPPSPWHRRTSATPATKNSSPGSTTNWEPCDGRLGHGRQAPRLPRAGHDRA